MLSDIYMESTPSNIYLSGNPGDPAGHVTFEGAKFQRGGDWGVKNPAATIDNYHGELNIVFDQMCDATQRFVVNGNNPMSLLLLGDYFTDSLCSLQSGPNAKIHCLANEGYKARTINFDCPPSLKDTDVTKAAPQAAGAFDDLRKLGEIDLKFNHPEVVQ